MATQSNEASSLGEILRHEHDQRMAAASGRLGDVVITHDTVRNDTWHGQTLHDTLDRSGIVDAVVRAIGHAEGGTVISVEGPWGSGKTHVLAMVAQRACASGVSSPAGLLWMNPWLMGEPNLLGKLCALLVADVRASLEKMKHDRQRARVSRGRRPLTQDELEDLAGALASLLVYVMAAWALPPAATIAARVEIQTLTWCRWVWRFVTEFWLSPEVALTRRLRDAMETFGASDPFDALMDAVRLLASEVKAGLDVAAAGSPPLKLVVFVDDLDRCLPDQQVAIMKQLHFLTRTGADLVFVVAVDPRLLEDALRHHYQAPNIDAAGYVQKLFHVRAEVGGGEIDLNVAETFVRALTSLRWPNASLSESELDNARTATMELVEVADLVTPRTLARMAARIHLRACAGHDDARAFDLAEVLAHWLWCDHADVARLVVARPWAFQPLASSTTMHSEFDGEATMAAARWGLEHVGAAQRMLTAAWFDKWLPRTHKVPPKADEPSLQQLLSLRVEAVAYVARV